ncbi:ABC transporter substrate-binding protein [Flavobacterium agricola]|uniref:ABC transporter substrate-binding protein n=1 Tax=Flavobacterium agricola TaxID=2870839 RepID=A0ABY6LYI1_9FLAO|nr:ABC transporter substrate-binding protein [Flavobacterium agricola]UYW00480.1 ABC transporter substrate-binding protein [Flavobacterium agricola]
MKKIGLLFGVLFLFFSCQKQTEQQNLVTQVTNEIEYAKNFELYSYPNFQLLKITKPWQQANNAITYVLAKNQSLVPDSLKKQPFIQVPVQKTIATSTTHIPSYDMLQEVESLIGFPNLSYISSPKVRENIKAGKITDVGENESLNTELIIDLAPDLIIGYGMESSNKTLDQFQKIGIPTIYNADWTEQTPLGKAEWIKFFGALFDKNELAKSQFDSIALQYNDLKKLAQTANNKPQVFSGGLYQNIWYAPKGTSWGAIFLEDANADYIWKETQGDGSIAISIEQALLDAKNTPIWLNPSGFETLQDVAKNSQHNLQFDAAKSGEIYTIANKKGETGGVIYYELGPNRPDLVLKDLIKILHPELLPDYELYFYEKLK